MAPRARFLLSLTAAGVLAGTAAFGAPVSEGGKRYVVQMTGAAEIPPGDPDGSGTAIITVNKGQQRVCWDITVSGVETIAAAHIHIGMAGQAFPGNIVVPLSPTSGCTDVTNEELLDALIKAPQVFYVNVHNATYPTGALRGQLG